MIRPIAFVLLLPWVVAAPAAAQTRASVQLLAPVPELLRLEIDALRPAPEAAGDGDASGHRYVGWVTVTANTAWTLTGRDDAGAAVQLRVVQSDARVSVLEPVPTAQRATEGATSTPFALAHGPRGRAFRVLIECRWPADATPDPRTLRLELHAT